MALLSKMTLTEENVFSKKRKKFFVNTRKADVLVSGMEKEEGIDVKHLIGNDDYNITISAYTITLTMPVVVVADVTDILFLL